MAHHQTSRALLILLTFQLYTLSLHASPQSFGPLIRDRAIRDRKQTSEEDLNANIERIYRKDFKTTVPPKEQNTDEVEPSPTELVARSQAPTRPRRPIENNEQNAMVYVYRDADGKLVPKFANPQPTTTTPRTTSNPDSNVQSSSDSSGMLVLKIATSSNATVSDTDPVFENGSYPAGYPFDMITKILNSHRDNYEHWFDNEIKFDPLATRANSEADKYLCSSDARTVYPTYDEETKRYIINVNGFYQPVVYEVCSNNGTECNKSSTAAKYKLVCLQTYRYYKMFVYPLEGDKNKLDFVDIRYPACCKCAQVERT